MAGESCLFSVDKLQLWYRIRSRWQDRVELSLKLRKTGHDGTRLLSQHSRSWGRSIVGSSITWATLCLRKKKIRNSG